MGRVTFVAQHEFIHRCPARTVQSLLRIHVAKSPGRVFFFAQWRIGFGSAVAVGAGPQPVQDFVEKVAPQREKMHVVLFQITARCQIEPREGFALPVFQT